MYIRKWLEKVMMKSFQTHSLHGIGIVCLKQIVSGIPCLIEKAMVHESISKLRNGKAAGPSGVVSEMARTGGEAGVDMITDLVNPTIVGVIPAEWELNTIVNCDAGKGDFLERGKYRGMKLIAQDSEDS